MPGRSIRLRRDHAHRFRATQVRGNGCDGRAGYCRARLVQRIEVGKIRSADERDKILNFIFGEMPNANHRVQARRKRRRVSGKNHKPIAVETKSDDVHIARRERVFQISFDQYRTRVVIVRGGRERSCRCGQGRVCRGGFGR